MNEILIVYLIVSCGVGFMTLPLLYIQKFSTFYNNDPLDFVVCAVIGFFFGWLLFPIFFLVGFIRIIRTFLGRE